MQRARALQPRHCLVELLRDSITADPEPDRRRVRISLPLPLRRLLAPSTEPRRGLWSNGRSNVRITLAVNPK